MRIVYASKDVDAAKAAAQAAEAQMGQWVEAQDVQADVLQLRAVEAPIGMLRGEHRWQLFVKLYFKADVEAVAAHMQAMAEAAPEGVRAELEVNPVNMI